MPFAGYILALLQGDGGAIGRGVAYLGNRMKAGREHRVPLSARAVEILGSMQGLRMEWLFPAANGGKMSAMAMTMLLRRMNVDVTVHGFRSSFRDWSAECTGYLARKRLPAFGIRQHGDALLVPMIDCAFRLWNVQRIYPDGRKLFLPGGRTEGLFWPHGALGQDGRLSAGPLVIGEGFATMAAVYHATGHGVVAAMSARNLQSVACAMRKLFPNRTLIVAADDDSHLSENVGLKAAQRAAESIGALLATPLPLGPEKRPATSGADFADIAPAEVAARIVQAGSAGHG